MAKQKTTIEQPTEHHTVQHTVRHYPTHPFGRYAGRRCIEMIVASTAGCEPLPLTGCSLDDPLSDADRALLLERGLATIDVFSGQFTVDYAALRAHLRTVCDVRDEDLPGLTWPSVLEILRPADIAADAAPPPLTPESHMSGEARALAILTDHPDWTDTRIAREAGVHVKSLYRYQRFKTARGVLKDSGRAGLPRGFKTDDGDIEAYE